MAPPESARFFDINDQGQIAGYQIAADGVYRASLWQGNAFAERVDLGPGLAYAVNNFGQAVGFDPYQPLITATLWDRNGATLFDAPQENTWAKNINDRGQIAGLFPNTGRAFVWDGRQSVDLLDLLGEYSVVAGINNNGLAVGSFNDARSGLPLVSRAALWNGSAGKDLNGLLRADSVQAGWVLAAATGINDAGWIAGQAYNRFACTEFVCDRYAFVLSPSDLPDRVLDITTAVPEPSTYALLMAGLAALVLHRRWRPRETAPRSG